MNARLVYMCMLYFKAKKINNPDLRNKYSIRFDQFGQDNTVRFTVYFEDKRVEDFVVTKKAIMLADLVTIAKEIPSSSIDKYSIASLVSKYTQGFYHEDVGTIMIDKDYVYVYINKKSYCYDGIIRIRRV